MKKKALLLVLSAALLVAASIGGTLAWLSDSSGPVINTFTAGDVEITLTETTGQNYVLVPGAEITKDPKVTVLANSEDCYVFVKVTNPLGQGIGLDILPADWSVVSTSGNDTVYKYIGTKANANDIILKNATDPVDLTVFTTVSVPENLKTLTGGQIVINAYAVQANNLPTGYTDAQIYALAVA